METFSCRAHGKHEFIVGGSFSTAREATGGHCRRAITIGRASQTIKV
jgi:hypothetical protein